MAEAFANVEVPGGPLWCGRVPGEGTPVVFVHGFSVDHTMWDAQVAALGDAAPIVRYDLRGFGASGMPDPERSHVDDLIALLDRLELDTVVVVGLSLGANVALALASEHPARTKAVVLASPGLPGRRWPTPRPPDLAMAHAHAHGVEAARRFWLDLPLFDSTRARPSAFARLSDMVARFPGHQWQSVPQARPLPALDTRLEQVHIPVAVLSGTEDDIGYTRLAVEIAERIPDAEHVAIAGAGHFVNLDEPEAFNDAVARALGLRSAPAGERA